MVMIDENYRSGRAGRPSGEDGQCACLSAGLKGINSFVFERNDDFQEILDFTCDMSKQYNMHVHKLHSDFKAGIEGLLETTNMKAIILGTRR